MGKSDGVTMTLLNQLRIALGADICEKCGSKNVKSQGAELWNHRFVCEECGHITGVMQV